MESEIERTREKAWRRNVLEGIQRGQMNGGTRLSEGSFSRRFIIPKHKFPIPRGS